MKKKTTRQAFGLTTTTLYAEVMLRPAPAVNDLSLPDLLDVRERLEIEAYQAQALRQGALGIHWGALGTPDEMLVQEATARLLELARWIERVDRLIAERV